MKEKHEIAVDNIISNFDKKRAYRDKDPKFLACSFSAFGNQLLSVPFQDQWGSPWLTLTQDGTVIAWEKPNNEALEKSIRRTIEEFSLVHFQSIPIVGNAAIQYEDEWAKKRGLFQSY